MIERRTQVAIVGAGPAGSLLALLLARAGIDAILLERRSREHVLARIRAGVLEHGSAELLRSLGIGERMEREGHVHEGASLAFGGGRVRIDFQELAGAPVVIYGQTEIQRDLYGKLDELGCALFDEVEQVALSGLDGARPEVTFTRAGRAERVACEYVIGCDGFHGVSRASMPAHLLRTYERVYPFGWLGILSRTPPVDHELIYASHARGFALCSMRNPELSRYYVQCPLDAELAAWTDARFWEELACRLPAEVAARLVTGPSIEKSIAPLRSFVAEPLRYGRLFLAGDAAHIVPPTGAKGLNLAFADVALLGRALEARFRDGSEQLLDAYSESALRRVWRAVRFSWWMTTLLHRFPDEEPFAERLRQAELELLAASESAQRLLALQYVGLQ